MHISTGTVFLLSGLQVNLKLDYCAINCFNITITICTVKFIIYDIGTNYIINNISWSARKIKEWPTLSGN